MAQESYKDQEGLFSNCPFIFRGAGQRAGGGVEGWRAKRTWGRRQRRVNRCVLGIPFWR